MKLKEIIVLIPLIISISSAFGYESDYVYWCNVQNVDSEVIVYKYKTQQINNGDRNSIDLWHSVRMCLESYGLNTDNIASLSSDIKEELKINDSQNPDEFAIPQWVKQSTVQWVNDPKSVYGFAFTIEFLSRTNIWDGSNVIPYAEATIPVIPEWFSDVGRWWIDEKISDSEFVDSLEYLTGKKIIRI